MAFLSSFGFVRSSLGRSLNIMRCVVLGSQRIRLCHNGRKDDDKTSAESDPNENERGDLEEDIPHDNTSDDYSSGGSTSEDSDEGLDDTSIRERILTAALQFVPEYGWSAEAIAEGAKAEGFSGMAEGMFTRKGGDLVLHFIDTCNVHLGHYLADNSLTQEENRKKISQSAFIKDAVQVRLRMVTPYIDSWSQAMSLMVCPSNAPDALQSLANMTDDIWYHSNDTSTDINWYFKRASLASIYGATELYLLQDKSDDFKDTWLFLDRRFQDIRSAGSLKELFSKAGEDVQSLACSSLTLVQNITGLNRWDR